MSTARWLLIGFVLVTSAACASAPLKAPTVDMTGTWQGTWTCQGCHGTKQGPMSVRLTQAGADITGKMSQADTPDNEIQGSVSGDKLTFRALGAGARPLQHHGMVKAVLSVNGSDMQGDGSAGQPLRISLRRNQ
jgi:hypothetical protein